jgi:putative transposase
MRYHRIRVPGAIYFFTVVTFERRPIFTEDRYVDLLRGAIRYTLARYPFRVNAAVILPEHLHMLWTLPLEDDDYSTRWRLIKSYFSRNWPGKIDDPLPVSRAAKGERAIWQRRFWEHLIRDDADYARHLDYIHYNPVKHGFVRSAGEWSYSSFSRYQASGIYPADWGKGEDITLDVGKGWE